MKTVQCNLAAFVKCGVVFIVSATTSGCHKSKSEPDRGINGISYKVIVSTRTPQHFEEETNQVWQEKALARMETSSGDIIICNHEMEYRYSLNDLEGAKWKITEKDPRRIDGIAEMNAIVRECYSHASKPNVDEIDGIKCDRFKYDDVVSVGQRAAVTVWISKENRLPVKIVKEFNGVLSSRTYEAVEINPIIDSKLFVPPPNVNFVESR